MIDLHCHILPGIDDGSRSWDESVEMARIAAADGITDIVATPHITPGLYDNTTASISALVSELANRLATADIRIRLHVGADVRVEPNVVSGVEAATIPVLGKRVRYLVAELPSQMMPPNIRELVYALQLRQIIPIITHPERHASMQQDPDLLRQLVAAGALAQVTAGSLTGEFGPVARRAANKMLERNLIHLIATDAHGTQKRRPVLTPGLAAAAAIVGEEAARAMVLDAPRAILAGVPVVIPEPVDPSLARGFLSRLFS
ncbi:MAG: capsular biosynthesis protein [candidate division NC10 bacterium]|nr:capsular biosynthesis protein [candidate division NC10 bacterium]